MRKTKRLIQCLVLTALFCATLLAQMTKSEEERALQNFESMGKTNAQILTILDNSHRAGFLYFTTDWCGACKELEKHVFAKPEFKQYLKDHFIPFLIDADKNTGPALKDLYHIGAYPTVAIVSPQGKVIDKIVGYDTYDIFLNKLKDIVKGIDTFEQLINEYNLAPNNEAKAITLAERYLSFYDYTSAKPILEKLILNSKNPKKMPEFLFGLGQYYYNLQSPQAAPFFERIIRESPDYPDIEMVYWELGIIYSNFEQQPQKRIELFESGIKKGAIKNYLSNVRYCEAVDSVTLKEWKNALGYLDKSSEYAPGLSFVPLLRSYCLTQMGRVEEGRRLFDKVYSDNSQDHQKLLQLISACIQFKVYVKEALTWMEPIAAQDGGKNSLILYGYAQLLALNGQKQKALSVMEKAVAMTPAPQVRAVMEQEVDKLRRELKKT